MKPGTKARTEMEGVEQRKVLGPLATPLKYVLGPSDISGNSLRPDRQRITSSTGVQWWRQPDGSKWLMNEITEKPLDKTISHSSRLD